MACLDIKKEKGSYIAKKKTQLFFWVAPYFKENLWKGIVNILVIDDFPNLALWQRGSCGMIVGNQVGHKSRLTKNHLGT